MTRDAHELWCGTFSLSAGLGFSSRRSKQSERFAWRKSRKHSCGLLTELTGYQLAEYVTEIRCDGEIAFFEELLRCEAGPSSVDLASIDGATQHHHHIAVTVIGATVPIFPRGAAELRHRDEDDVRHSIAHVFGKGREGVSELLQQL